MKTIWFKVGTVILLAMVIPGVLLGIVSASWKIWVLPFTTITLEEMAQQPILNIVLAIMWFFATPSACIMSLSSFIAGVKIWFD